MKKLFYAITAVSFLFIGLNYASEPVGMASRSSLLEQGDRAFRNRKAPESAMTALEIYRRAYAQNKNQIEAGWRVAMACYFVGLKLETKSDSKELIFQEGRDAGLRSAELNPSCAPCHFWAAINMALYGQTVGVFKMLFSINEIQSHLNKTIELDPKYAYSGAYRLLGLIQQKLPGKLGGSNEKAKEYFNLAIEQSPAEPMNYLFRFLTSGRRQA